jgi:hypothetical protein
VTQQVKNGLGSNYSNQEHSLKMSAYFEGKKRWFWIPLIASARTQSDANCVVESKEIQGIPKWPYNRRLGNLHCLDAKTRQLKL